MKAILLLFLFLAPGIAQAEEEVVQLAVGVPYTPKQNGAFITDNKAALIKAAFEREKYRSEKCLEALEKKTGIEPNTVVLVGVGSFLVGALTIITILRIAD